MSSRQWTMITPHGLVLVYLFRNPDSTLRQLARVVGVTERHIARIVRDLVLAGAVTKHKKGLRNSYTLNLETTIRHPVLTRTTLRELVHAIAPFVA
jgi:DNA-binding IclR family transcriptional regulator